MKIFPKITMILGMCLIAGFTYMLITTFKPINIISTDYIAFYTGAKVAKEFGFGSVFDLEKQTLVQQEILNQYKVKYIFEAVRTYRNPIIAVGLIYPLAYIEFEFGYKILLTIYAILLAVCVGLLNNQHKYTHPALPIISFFFLPSISALVTTQFSIVVFGALLGTMTLLYKKHPLYAGLVLGLLFVKPQFLIIVPILIAIYKFNYRLIAGLVLSITFLFIVNLYLGGLHSLITYPKFLSQTEGMKYGTDVLENFNPQSLIFTLKLGGSIQKPTLYMSTILLWITCFIYALVSKNPTQYKLTALFIVTPLMLIHTMASDLIIHLIPIWFLMSAPEKETKQFRYILAGILFLTPFLGVAKLAWIANFSYLGIFAIFTLKSPTVTEISLPDDRESPHE